MTFIRQLVLEISRFKVTNMDVATFYFKPRFRLNEDQYDIIVALLKNNGRKYNVRKTIGQISLKFCRFIEFFNKISFFVKFRCHDN